MRRIMLATAVSALTAGVTQACPYDDPSWFSDSYGESSSYTESSDPAVVEADRQAREAEAQALKTMAMDAAKLRFLDRFSLKMEDAPSAKPALVKASLTRTHADRRTRSDPSDR